MKKIFILLFISIISLFIFGCNENVEEPSPIYKINLPDSEILNKDYNATLFNGEYAKGDITFNVNYGLFLESNTIYNNDLALLGAALCNDLSDTWCTKLEDVTYKIVYDKTILFKELGLLDPLIVNLRDNDYEVDANDVSKFGIGHYPIVKDNTRYEVVVVSVSPTMGDIEWKSNVDVGADSSKYFELNGDSHPDWKNLDHHKGFDVSANRISTYIDNYIANLNPSANKILYITGYSRGAAVANILSANYTNNPNYKVFGYTFETPNTICTTNDTLTNYKNIFNICTSRDIVTFVPLSSWGFKRYGVDMIMDVNPTTYENLTGDQYYQTSEEEFSHINILDGTRTDIYEKEVVLYDGTKDSNGNKTVVEYNYNEFTRLINQLDNSELFTISELECVDEEKELYNFTIKGSLSCLIEVISYFIPIMYNMTTTNIVELVSFMSILNYYMPFFEDLIYIVGLNFDTTKIATPHYLMSTVSALLDYNK